VKLHSQVQCGIRIRDEIFYTFADNTQHLNRREITWILVLGGVKRESNNF
jgi:hypothetical protein